MKITSQESCLSISYEDIKAVNEKIIYCSLTGYGDTGPYAERAGYDVIAASVGGLLNITGTQEGEPCRVGVAMTDLATGLYAHGAILAALMHREKTGIGQKIDCNLLSTQVAVLSHVASAYLNADIEAKRWGTGHANIVPYQAFQTKDQRMLTIGAGNNAQFSNLCEVLDLTNLSQDARFKSNHDRVKNRDVLITKLQERFNSKTLEKWMELLEGCGFPYGPINNIKQVFDDPQVIHNQMTQSMFHPHLNQDIKIAGPAVKFNSFAYSNAIPPPVLGEHTSEVLREVLNLDDNEIRRLHNEKVILAK